jgi:hypothetical protein
VTACAIAAALVASGHRSFNLDPVVRLHAIAHDDLPGGVTISDSVKLDIEAGEVQSTVVPPGKKWACPYGRLVISSDYGKDPAEVAFIPLDNLSASPGSASFDTPASFNVKRRIRSNDHDLVAFPNGDLLLVKMGQSTVPLFDETGQQFKPNWFDYAYKLGDDKDGNLTEAWGPGARSELLIWRSTDCGNNFTFVSSIDTATLDDEYGTPDDGSGGLPQSGKDTVGGKTVWQMGGTDGPLVRVERQTSRVFVTIGLVGNKPATESPFSLSGAPLNRTVVMMSEDKGETWSRAAVLPFSGWRVDVVPRPNNKLAFADMGWSGGEGYAFLYPNRPIGFGILSYFDSPAYGAPVKPGQWGWHTLPWNRPVLYKKDQSPDDYMKVNVHAQTLLSRSPSSTKLLMAYPDTIDTNGDGYRVYIHNGESSWLKLPSVTPRSAAAPDFALHLTAVDPGRGPLLLYWYDVDTNAKTAVMRGRLITGDNLSTADFSVSRDGSAEASFDVTTAAKFYGDYHTAGAYYVKPNADAQYAYHYYPVWIEADGFVHVAHVTLDRNPKPAFNLLPLSGYIMPSALDRITLRELIDPTRLAIRRTEEEEPSRQEPVRDPDGR